MKYGLDTGHAEGLKFPSLLAGPHRKTKSKKKWEPARMAHLPRTEIAQLISQWRKKVFILNAQQFSLLLQTPLHAKVENVPLFSDTNLNFLDVLFVFPAPLCFLVISLSLFVLDQSDIKRELQETNYKNINLCLWKNTLRIQAFERVNFCRNQSATDQDQTRNVSL